MNLRKNLYPENIFWRQIVEEEVMRYFNEIENIARRK